MESVSKIYSGGRYPGYKCYAMNKAAIAAVLAGRNVALCLKYGVIGVSLTEGGIGLKISFTPYYKAGDNFTSIEVDGINV